MHTKTTARVESARPGGLGLRKARRAHHLIAAAGLVAGSLLAAKTARADMFWDANGSNTGGSNTNVAPGTWGIDPFWNVLDTGTGLTRAWVANERAVFSAGSNVTGAYTVNVVGRQLVDSIWFKDGNVTLSGGELELTFGDLLMDADATIESTISGNFSLTTSGMGTLTLTGINAFAGPILVGGNTLVIGSDAALGVTPFSPTADSITLDGGTLASLPDTDLTINSNRGITVTEFGGALNAVGTSNISYGGVIAGIGDLTKLGTGTLYLSGANTYQGGTYIEANSGRIVISNGAALGTSSDAFDGTIIRGGNNGVSITGNITTAESFTLSGSNGTLDGPGQLDNLFGANVLTGNIVLNGSASTISTGLPTIGATSGVLTHTGVMSGSGNFQTFMKVGPGTLVLGGSSPNTYTGTTRIAGGYLIAEKDQAFGAATGGIIMMPGGRYTQTVGLRAPGSTGKLTYTAAESLTLAGFSNETLGEGLLHNFGGNNSWAGPVKLGNGSTGAWLMPNTIGAAENSTLSILGSVSNDGTGARNLTKVGKGTLTLSGANTNSGPIVVKEGTLSFSSQVGLPSTGTWTPSDPASSSISVAPGAALRFDNTGAINTARTGAVPINLFGGRFELYGNSSAQVLQPGNTLNVYGHSTIAVSRIGGQIVRLDDLNRMSRGTLLFSAPTGPSGAIGGQLTLSSGPGSLVGGGGAAGTSTISILPFAIADTPGPGTSFDLTTYDANGVRALAGTEYATGITSGGSSLVNALVSSSQGVAANTTVNSLKLHGAGAISIDAGISLTLNSGVILDNAGTAGGTRDISGGTLNFGGAEGIIYTSAGRTLAVGSALNGTNGLTVSGQGNLLLTGANNMNGPLTLDGGRLVVGNSASLSSSPIVFNGGVLAWDAAMPASLNVAQSITTNSAYGGFDIASGKTVTVDGAIGGNGALVMNGQGTLALNGTNTYSGGTVVNGGVVSIASDSVLGGVGVITLNGGTLSTTESMLLNPGRTLVLTGKHGAIEVPAGKQVSAPMLISGQGSLIKRGEGMLTLGEGTASNSYLGNTIVEAGVLAYGSEGGLTAEPGTLAPDHWLLRNGGTVQVQSSSSNSTGFSSPNRGITLENGGGIAAGQGATWTYRSVISGTGGLSKRGEGTVNLVGENTYSGPTTIEQGVLAMGAAGALPAGTRLTFSAAQGSGVMDLNGFNATISGISGASVNPSGNILRNSANAPSTLTIDSSSDNTFGGTISGNLDLVKTGTGRQVLTGTSTYGGTTTITDGTLVVDGLIGGTGVTVQTGGALGGSGSINAGVAVAGGTISPGNQSAGNLNLLSGLNMEQGGQMLWQISDLSTTSGFDTLSILSGALALGDNSSLALDFGLLPANLRPDAAGRDAFWESDRTWKIIDVKDLGTNPDLTNFATVLNGVGGTFTTFVGSGADQGDIFLKFASGEVDPPQWKLDGGGTWNNAANWIGGVPDAPGAAANLLGKLSTAANAPATITLDGDRTIGTLVLQNTTTNGVNPNSYIIAAGTGGKLILNNNGQPAQVNVLAGAHQISAAVQAIDDAAINVAAASRLHMSGGFESAAGKQVIKAGAGVLEISGGMLLGAGGKLNVQTGSMLADNIRGGGALEVHGGASLTLKKGGGPSVVSSVTFDGASGSWSGRLDLTDNDLIIHSDPANRSAALALTTSQVRNARNSPLGRWKGDGITTSETLVDPNTGLAVVLNDRGNGTPIIASIDGQMAGINDVIVRYTWNGDADLSGRINADDYFRIDSGFLAKLPNPTYRDGDFNYDSKVNADDYFLIDSAFLGQKGVLSAGPLAVVPEPGSLGLVLGAAALMWRRRR